MVVTLPPLDLQELHMALPTLTPEQRTAALAKAARARRERAEVQHRLKHGGASIADVIAERTRNQAVAKMRVTALLRAMPGVGPARARQIMEEIGIAQSRRVGGLGTNQVAELVRRFEGG